MEQYSWLNVDYNPLTLREIWQDDEYHVRFTIPMRWVELLDEYPDDLFHFMSPTSTRSQHPDF